MHSSKFHSTRFAAKRSAATGGAYLVAALVMFALCMVLSRGAKGEVAYPHTVKVEAAEQFRPY
jgi:hypothetical protein